MRNYVIIILVLGALSLSSCATILSGTSDQITFRSEPPGAKVLLNGNEIGETNNSITVKRKEGKKGQFTYQKDGYESVTFKNDVKITPAYWGSIACYIAGIIPGAVFSVIDLSTGACYQPKNTMYEKTLTPKKK